MFDNHFTEADNYTICLLASARVLETDNRMSSQEYGSVTGLLHHWMPLMTLHFGDVTLKCALS